MGLIADILLVAGALGATFYCFVLSRRLAKFNNLERGVGGAVAVLSAQVDDMTKALGSAEVAAKSSTSSLDDLTERAEGVARRLELLVAAMHDLPDPEARTSRPQKAANQAEAVSEPEAAGGDTKGVLFLRHRVVPTEAAE